MTTRRRRERIPGRGLKRWHDPVPQGLKLPPKHAGSGRTVEAREKARLRAATNGRRPRT